jgi:tetratricopeptide (TPR) repeat protein
MTFKNKKKHKFRNLGEFEKLGKLEEAEFLIEGGLWSKARSLLVDATQKYPSETRFWEMLAEAASRLDDVPAMQKAFGKLVQLVPARANVWFGLAYAYGIDDRIALGYRGFRTFLDKFPGDENAATAAELLAAAEPSLQKTIAGYGFPEGDRGIELLCLNDEAQVLMRQGDFAKAREKAATLIGFMPDYAPAYNNLSLIFYMDGEVEKASETARKILTKQPENFHALANLVRYSVFLGNGDEAGQFSNRLKSVKSNDQDIWIKKIEAFTFLGDDQAVVEIYEEAVKKKLTATLDNFSIHLAAYANYRIGHEKEARKLWKKIVKGDPYFDFAIENLKEMELLESERSIVGLPLNNWMPERFINELMRESTSLKDNKNFERNLRKKIGAFFAKYPNILNLFSVFLERGDETARNFAVRLLDLAGTPEAHSALKDFAFSQNGPDSHRYQAAMKLADAGIIPNKVRLWNGDEWREMRLLTFEITGEPVETYPMKPKAVSLYEKGFYALQDRKLELAEQYLKMALEAQGADHPSILFNLLAVEQIRGNDKGAEAELTNLIEEFPDYTLGAIRLAIIAIDRGNVEEAKRLTEKFYDKKLWHIGEIFSWFHFNILLALEEREYASARTSLDAWHELDDNLDYEYWHDVISKREFLSTLPLFRQEYGKKA